MSPGDRVELVRTTDEYTHLRPGALGTVVRVSNDLGRGEVYHIRWDDGSNLSMLPGEGDVVAPA